SRVNAPSFPLAAGILSGGPRHAPYSPAGALFPQPHVRTPAGTSILFDEVLRQSFALLGYNVGPRQTLDVAALASWEDLAARFVTVIPPDGTCTAVDGAKVPVVCAVEGVIAQW